VPAQLMSKPTENMNSASGMQSALYFSSVSSGNPYTGSPQELDATFSWTKTITPNLGLTISDGGTRDQSRPSDDLRP
jgi:hypothetical protein